jgi:hypothetical protein
VNGPSDFVIIPNSTVDSLRATGIGTGLRQSRVHSQLNGLIMQGGRKDHRSAVSGLIVTLPSQGN